MTGSTPHFDAFVEPARRRPQLWRLALGLVVVLVVFFAWLAGLFGQLVLFTGVESGLAWANRVADAITPTTTLLLLATFVGMALGPMAAVWLLHGRPVASLFGPADRFWRDFRIACATVAVVFTLATIPWFMAFEVVPNMNFGLWLSYLPLALVGVFVQTGAEEIVFRGYLTQQLAARFASPWIWMLAPSVVFGLLHYDPITMGDAAWTIVAVTTLFGLAAADLVRVTGSLGAAWGLHFANNVAAILIIGTQGTITGLALAVTPYDASEIGLLDPRLLGDAALIAFVWALLRRLLRP